MLKYNAIGFAPNTTEGFLHVSLQCPVLLILHGYRRFTLPVIQLMTYVSSQLSSSTNLNMTFVGFNSAEDISQLSEKQGSLSFFAG